MGNGSRLAAARNEEQGNERVTPEQWQRVKAVLTGALERAPDQRHEYVNQVCVEQSVRSEVESLLAAHDQAGDPAVLFDSKLQGLHRREGFDSPGVAARSDGVPPGRSVG